MGNSDRFFFDRFGLTEANLSQYLGAALSEGGEYADLYFEHTTSSSLLVDESLVKTATEGISMGCGVRVVAGEQTGYAYTDDLAPEKIMKAAKIAPVQQNVLMIRICKDPVEAERYEKLMNCIHRFGPNCYEILLHGKE